MPDALVTYLTWDRLVPWKVLSLPRRATDDFLPVGYGSKSTTFRKRAVSGATLWVVSRPPRPRGAPPTLVARLRVKERCTSDHYPPDCHSRGADELLRQWESVAVARPGDGAFFELNDASAAMATLGLAPWPFYRVKVFPDPAKVRKAFRGCMRQSRERTVFISYTHAEAEATAHDLAQGLLKRGFSPWLDGLTIPAFDVRRDGPRADRLEQLLRMGVSRASLAVCLVTPTYGRTPWTRKEWRWINRRRKEDSRFRCVHIPLGGSSLRGCRSLPPGPALAERIAVWWKWAPPRCGAH